MSDTNSGLGQAGRPLRVAIVGSGPAGFYTADFLLKGNTAKGASPKEQLTVEVDLYERLPTPFGLVRSGVAPDHQSIKKVTKAFERIGGHERFRLLGNVNVGTDIKHEELLEHYDHVVYAVGSPTDRRLRIPGEDLGGSGSATSFVGWYNGHPDFRDLKYDFSTERAIVVGLGNVAMDVARILIRDPEELADSDIAGYALDALRTSKIKEVVLLGRRGAAQAAFTPREIRDISELSGVQVCVDGGAAAVDIDESALTGNAKQNVEFVKEAASQEPDASQRKVRLRFLASPVEILGEDGRMRSVKVEANELVDAGNGRLSAKGTGKTDTIEAGLIFRSIGYQSTPIPGVPFDEKSATVPNQLGRVTQTPGGDVVPNLYVVGWVKRGPSGLIGTNKTDAKETSECMLEDAASSSGQPRSLPPREAIDELLNSRSVRVVTMADWRKLDEVEIANGKKVGKVREKFSNVAEMLAALDA